MPDGEDIAKPVNNNDANSAQTRVDLNMKMTLMLIAHAYADLHRV